MKKNSLLVFFCIVIAPYVWSQTSKPQYPFPQNSI